MHRWRSIAVAATLAAVVSVGACGGSSGSGTASPAPSTSGTNDAVAWADQVCGSVLKFTDAVKQQPTIDQSNPAAAIKSLIAYIGTAVDGLQQAIAGLNAAGTPPISGGDQVVTKLKQQLTTIQSTFADVKAKLSAINPNDPSALASIPAALDPLQQLANTPNPLDDAQANSELKKAAEQAPNCQKAGLTSTSPSSSPTS